MIIQLLPADIALPAGSPRTEGVHLSRVIRNIAVKQGMLKKEWVEDLSLVEVGNNQAAWWDALDPASRLRMSIGLAWESWYVPQLGNVAFHPGEMELDGIYMTHDGESLDAIIGGGGYELCCHEVKATYKSIKTVGNLANQFLLLAQTKGYCKGLGVKTAYVHMLFLCGDYSYPMTPQLRKWRIDYTQLEIEDHWDVIKSYVQHYLHQEREDLMRDTL